MASLYAILVRLPGKNAAVVEAICERGNAEITIYLDEQKPRCIGGFYIKLLK